MKTVIDAVNNFMGNYDNDADDNLCDDERCVIVATKRYHEEETYIKGAFYFGGKDYNKKVFNLICTKEEFIQCVEDMSKAEWIKPVTISPIYTQEMADNGGIVEPGMLFATEAGEYTAEYTNKKSIVFTDEDGFLISTNRRYAKPITPPIELIDGKAYQFETQNKTVEAGIYFLGTDIFYRGAGYFKASDCTNIKLLEVKL